MFEEMVVSGAKERTNKPWTVVVSMILQVLFLLILILIPLIYTEALPKAMLSSILLAPPPPPPPPPPPAAVQVVKIKPMVRLMDAGKLVAPKAIPKDINIIKEEELPPDVGMQGVAGGVPGGVAGGSMGGVLGGVIGGGKAPPPPKVVPKRVTVGGNVQAARLVNKVQPLYPPLARQTRISGTVKLHAIIGKDGSVQQLQMVSGHPLLVQAALDAVRQWRYQPTLLNGEPVEVDTEIDVIFSLAQ